MDVSNKKTVLDDSADIYQARQTKTEREKWQEMKTFAQKWDYFKEYYLVKLIIAVTAIVLIASLIYNIAKPKPENIFYAAIIDYVVPETSRLQMEEEFFAYLEGTEEQKIELDDTFAFAKDYNYAIRERFMTYAFGGEMDVILMPETLFEAYVAYYAPLAEELPTDLYNALSEYFVSAPRRDSQGNVLEGTEQFYGIDVSSVPLMQGTSCEERVILVIVNTSARKDNATEFVRYLFETE